MCGICGMAGEVDEALLQRMMLALRHRGPDDQGSHVDRAGGVGLGHLRLSIIDVAGGHQPIYNEDRSLCIVLNGEIYNHQELRAEMEVRGHTFQTHSDTETILHLYEDEGERAPERLQGMFAFAIWNAERRELFLARDRLGIKPLFTSERSGRFLFASEMKAILADPATPREMDPVGLDQYLTFMYVPAPRTILKSVRKLPPGHSLTLRDGRARTRCYWRLPEPQAAQAATLAETTERVRDLLGDAVRCRLMSEVPLGAYLSGGLDSSVVVGLMSQAQRAPNTFSVGFSERGFDESRFARIVADHFGTTHHELVCRHGATDELTQIIWHLDEPVADAAAIPTYLMARETKPHATVVLTGEGADELFAGYSHYRLLLRRALLRPCAALFGRAQGSSYPERAMAMCSASADPARFYLALKTVFTDREKADLLRPGLRRPDGAETPLDLVSPYLNASGGDALQRLLRLDIATWLADDLLVKVDRMTMAHAVEARVPYLDHRVVEACLPLPIAWKLGWGQSKVLLRRVARQMLPDAIVRRRKTGFGVPVGQWASGELRGLVDDVLGRAATERRGIMAPDVVARLLSRRPFNMFHRRQFWALFVLEMWCRVFLDRDPASRP